MADVFISYARSTANQAQSVARALEGLGYDVWMDVALPTHRAYSEVIEEQLHAAAAVVVIWSPDAAKSEWVRSEANRGRNDQKLVQVAVERIRLPMPFDQIHCADLSDWAGNPDHLGWKAVTASIAVLVEGKNGARPEEFAAPAVSEQTTPRNERRHLTVLTAGLVNAGRLAATLDPEEWQSLSAQFNQAAGAAIRAHGGYVAKAGDSIVAYFGYPVAQEYAAERAVRAALALVEAIAQLRATAELPRGVELAASVGLHVGTVVISPDSSGGIEVFGDVPALSADIQKSAGAGAVVLTSDVHNLVSGQFLVEDRGVAAREGGGGDLNLFRALSPAVASRHGRGYSPRSQTAFVGREEEVGVLNGRWRRACDGEGQLVLLVGEAGIGKSRLVEEFRERITSEPHLWVDCGAGPLYANTTFHPVADMLGQTLGWRGDETAKARLLTLQQSLSRTGLNPAEATPLIAEMLDLPQPANFPTLALSPEERRRRLLAVLAQWTLGAAAHQPLVLVMEDLHWMDPSTMELIHILAEQLATARLLLVCTARPEFKAAWPPRSHHTLITVNRLSARETRELVAGVTAKTGLAKEMLEAVIRRTDGVPLFAEELTRLMMERGGQPEARDIPATLLDSLSARLDRLGGAREVAQLGAVLGREFTFDLVKAVSKMPEADLKSGLDRLADAELVYVRGAPPEATYLFKHALILDAAYASLLKSSRRQLHARAAQAITEGFPAIAEAQPEVLARHWNAAGEVDKAIAAWTTAGQRASSRAAHVEAAGHFRAALEIVEALAQGTDRANTELTLLLGLAVSISASQGYTSPEVAEVLGRARTICDHLGNVAGLFGVMLNICHFYTVAGEEEPAMDAAARCLKIAEETHQPDQLIQAHFNVGYMLYSRAELAAGRKHLELSAALYRKHRDEPLVRYGPSDPLVEALSPQPIVLYAMGEEEAAAARSDEQLAHVRSLGSPYDLAYGLGFRWVYKTLAGDFEEALRCAEEIVTVSEANGYPIWRDVGLGDRGLSLGRLGQFKEGREFFQAAIAEQRRSGNVHALGLYLGEVAKIYLEAGEEDAALATVDEALTWASRSYLFILPRLHVLRAEILARRSPLDNGAAKAALRAALEIAGRHGARKFVIEAETALASL
ncbi:MAG TPA: AAA family ATPase [Caulobacteraceae bacterium]|jgi:class 3 adenylate cyclase/tetratricopeptide (TPR) repeat protein